MFPSPVELQYFLEVAQTFNISRASERLGISQPTLSLAMQRLERSFGVPLLIRGKSGVQLTAAGRRLAVQARGLVQEWEQLRAHARRSEKSLGGVYVLGCHTAVALYSLPHFLAELLGEHPGLEIKLVHDLSRKITEDVISFKVDFGLVINPVEHPDLVIRQLSEDQMGLWTASEPSPLQMPKNKNATLIYDPELRQSQWILERLGRAGIRFSRLLPSSDLEVIATLVEAGAGVGILPERMARRQGRGLKPLHTKERIGFADKLCLVYRADAQKTRASRLISEKIIRRLGSA